MLAQRSNSKKRKSYASMDVEKKSALLHSRRLKYRERVANRGDPGASTSTQSTQTQQIYMHRSSVIQPALLNRIEDIPLRAWSLPFSTPCPFCGAFLYLREPKGFCCLSGQISLALPTMPHELWNLYTSLDSADAVHFRKRCRTYNNTTAFSSLGITYDESLAKSNKGIYSLHIQGAVYHFIRDLIPAEGPGRQLQLYFYEPENGLHNRLSQSGDLQLHILQHIVELMRRNPYALFFRGLQELPNLHEYNIVLRADPSLDMRIYNLPTVNQVAAIWNEMTGVPAAQPHDIRVYTSSGQTHCVHYYYGCYDPLQYPLLFPFRESGWHAGIRRISLASATAHSRQHRQCSGQTAVYPHGHHSAESILGAELQSTSDLPT
ncbi:hypothetical protein OROMI_020763 [Orobanche minor]